MAAKIVLVGAGGHASVLADIIASTRGLTLVGAVDPDPRAAAALPARHLGGDEALPGLLKKGVRLAAVGVGSVGDNAARAALRRKLQALGFTLPPLVHPRAVVARSAALGPGCQIAAAAVINPRAKLGAGVLVNTGAVVEHDCRLGDDAFVGPLAGLGGGVTLEASAFVGLGAFVLQGLTIGKGAVVGAGAVAVKDVRAGAVVVGVPAKERK
jgi:UDP-perosamine 4-acetyltransferase